MYLSAKVIIPAVEWKDIFNSDREPVENGTYKDIVDLLGLKEFMDADKFSNSITVEVPVGYWRKANSIHGWFVRNAGSGDQDSGLFVDNEQLAELLETCKEVLADRSKAMELLPPMGGFFFGSYEIDEYYEEDLKHTVDILNRCLESPFNYFIYESSW